METPRAVRILCAFLPLLLACSATGWAQTPQAPPRITVRDFLPVAQRRGLPVARWSKDENRVAVTVPGDRFFTDALFIEGPGETFADVTRDRILLGKDASGAPITARLLKAGAPGGLPNTPSVAITGDAAPLSFSSYLTDPAVFPDHKQLNEIRYATTRGVSPDDYRFVGFARSHGAVYVGVLYVNRAPSDQVRGHNGFLPLLFRLTGKPGEKGWTLRVVALPALPNGNTWNPEDPLDGPPLLEVAREDGDLYLLYGDHIWRRGASSTWKDTGSLYALLPRLSSASPEGSWRRRTSVYLRGRWLILNSETYVPKPRGSVRVFDVETRRLVRAIEWPMRKEE